MYRQQISRKTSSSFNRTSVSRKQSTTPSYEPLSSVVRRAQQDPKSLSGDEWQALESAIGTRAKDEILAGKQTPWVPEFRGISTQLWGETGQVTPPIQAKNQEEEREPDKLTETKTSGVPEFKGISAQLWGDSGQSTLPIQAKLTIGAAGDKYEREADRVAKAVVQQINHPAPVSRTPGEVVQGKKREEEDEIKGQPISALPSQEAMGSQPKVQCREGIGGGIAPPNLESAINQARGGGQPLDAGLQETMGQAMGADFSGVRIHADAQSTALNRSLQAKAFTTGQDIFFRQGEYEPQSQPGKEMIAHELTHVVQQNGEGVKSSPSHTEQSMPLSIGAKKAPPTACAARIKKAKDCGKTLAKTQEPPISGQEKKAGGAKPQRQVPAKIKERGAPTEGVIQRLSEEEVELVLSLLKKYGDVYFQITKKDLRKKKNKLIKNRLVKEFGINLGHNFQLSSLIKDDSKKEKIIEGSKNEDPVVMLIVKVIITGLKNKKVDLFKELEDYHQFTGDKENAAKNLLTSKLLKEKEPIKAEEKEKPKEEGENVPAIIKLQQLSAKNLKYKIRIFKMMRLIVGKLHKSVEEILKKFYLELKERYKSPIVAHATKAKIQNQINSTRKRLLLASFLEKLTGERNKYTKGRTNTKDMNVKHFESHDFVFLNVYPQINDEILLKVILSSSRFLTEDYAKQTAKISPKAHTYIWRHLQFGDTRLVVMTLRDPVYPSGGKGEDESKKRISNAKICRTLKSHDPGKFKYKFAGERRFTVKQWDYNTRKNLFVGDHIQAALSVNVMLGIYRIIYALGVYEAIPILSQIIRFLQEKDEMRKDWRLLQIVKYFQYPQLMVSDTMNVKDKREVIEWQKEKKLTEITKRGTKKK